MCLKTIESTAKGRSTKVLTGYKIMSKGRYEGDKLWCGLFYGFVGYESSKWYQSKVRSKKMVYWRSDPNMEYCDNKQEYEIGFHIYPTLEDAKKDVNFIANGEYKIVKVEYYGLLARGTEGNMRSSWGGCGGFTVDIDNPPRSVVVARNMKIIGEAKDES